MNLIFSGGHEVANTEVSSNLSISRTEEAARLRDVEDSFEDKYTKVIKKSSIGEQVL